MIRFQLRLEVVDQRRHRPTRAGHRMTALDVAAADDTPADGGYRTRTAPSAGADCGATVGEGVAGCCPRRRRAAWRPNQSNRRNRAAPLDGGHLAPRRRFRRSRWRQDGGAQTPVQRGTRKTPRIAVASRASPTRRRATARADAARVQTQSPVAAPRASPAWTTEPHDPRSEHDQQSPVDDLGAGVPGLARAVRRTRPRANGGPGPRLDAARRRALGSARVADDLDHMGHAARHMMHASQRFDVKEIVGTAASDRRSNDVRAPTSRARPAGSRDRPAHRPWLLTVGPRSSIETRLPDENDPEKLLVDALRGSARRRRTSTAWRPRLLSMSSTIQTGLPSAGMCFQVSPRGRRRAYGQIRPVDCLTPGHWPTAASSSWELQRSGCGVERHVDVSR